MLNINKMVNTIYRIKVEFIIRAELSNKEVDDLIALVNTQLGCDSEISLNILGMNDLSNFIIEGVSHESVAKAASNVIFYGLLKSQHDIIIVAHINQH